MQLSELGIYKTVDTGSKEVKLSLSKTADTVPMTSSVKVNGVEVATTLPNTVIVKNGDTITVSADTDENLEKFLDVLRANV